MEPARSDELPGAAEQVLANASQRNNTSDPAKPSSTHMPPSQARAQPSPPHPSPPQQECWPLTHREARPLGGSWPEVPVLRAQDSVQAEALLAGVELSALLSGEITPQAVPSPGRFQGGERKLVREHPLPTRLPFTR